MTLSCWLAPTDFDLSAWVNPLLSLLSLSAGRGGWPVQTQMQRNFSGWWERSSFSGPNPTWVLCFLGSFLILFFFFVIFLPVLCHVTCFLFYFLQNFKREEQNFVVMNEINNMSFLTADSKSKMSKVRVDKEANGQVKHSLLIN